jgi:hypothetical protein
MVQKSTSSCRSVFGERLISVWPVKRRNEAPESSTFSKLNCLRYRNVNASACAIMSGIAITACKQNHPTSLNFQALTSQEVLLLRYVNVGAQLS